MASADALPLSASSSAPFRFWTIERRRRYTFFACAAAAWLAYGSISAWRDRHAFIINVTDSLPNWAFMVERGRWPAKGEIVVFAAPRNASVLRHFGERPPLFSKHVLGVQGDTVSRVGTTVYVNGREVARTKPVSRLGERLAPGPVGVIPKGCLYAGTSHKDGYDSRYAAIGWVCRKSVVGTGTPVL